MLDYLAAEYAGLTAALVAGATAALAWAKYRTDQKVARRAASESHMARLDAHISALQTEMTSMRKDIHQLQRTNFSWQDYAARLRDQIERRDPPPPIPYPADLLGGTTP